MRQAMLIGAVLGGADGKRYLERLIDNAWEDDPKLSEKAKALLSVAEARRGNREPAWQNQEDKSATT